MAAWCTGGCLPAGAVRGKCIGLSAGLSIHLHPVMYAAAVKPSLPCDGALLSIGYNFS